MSKIKLTKQGIDKFTKGIKKPFENAIPFFKLLGVKIGNQTRATFRMEGARSGESKWPPFSPRTLRTLRGTWNIRYGTDKNPKRTAEELSKYKSKNNLWYKPGPMKGYQSQRRYGPNAKLLQASGEFMRSFRIRSVSRNSLRFGSLHRLAQQIMSSPKRPVLFVTRGDKEEYFRLFRSYVLRTMAI